MISTEIAQFLRRSPPHDDYAKHIIKHIPPQIRLVRSHKQITIISDQNADLQTKNNVIINKDKYYLISLCMLYMPLECMSQYLSFLIMCLMSTNRYLLVLPYAVLIVKRLYIHSVSICTIHPAVIRKFYSFISYFTQAAPIIKYIQISVQ